MIATSVIVAITIILPYTPLGAILGFSPLPGSFLLVIGIVVVIYILAAERVKMTFFKRMGF